jgi:hypothetical protein
LPTEIPNGQPASSVGTTPSRLPPPATEATMPLHNPATEGRPSSRRRIIPASEATVQPRQPASEATVQPRQPASEATLQPTSPASEATV